MSNILNVQEQIIRPGRKRVCVDCDREIIRNLAITADGLPHHFGCLKKDHAKPAWHCISCGAELNRSKVVKGYVEGVLERACGLCGGIVEPLRNYTRSFQVVRGK